MMREFEFEVESDLGEGSLVIVADNLDAATLVARSLCSGGVRVSYLGSSESDRQAAR
jgi:hypothetical protein